MFGQQGTGLPLLINVMSHLPLIKKSLCKKDLLRQAEFHMASRPSYAKSSQLNIRAIEQKNKRRKLHQAELFIASRPSHTKSAELNSRLAMKAAHVKRLRSAQMISITK